MAFSGSNVGTTVSISLGVPASPTVGNFNALTWTPITGIDSWPSGGDELGEIEFTGLDGRTISLAGALKGAGGEFSFRSDEADAGQIALRSTNNTGQNVSIRVLGADGLREYSYGLIASVKSNPRTPTSYIGFTGTWRPNSPTIRG